MATKNDGTEAEKAFERLIAADDLYRFPDQKMLRGLNNGRPVGDFPKPSDYLVTKGGSTWYAEVKSTHNKTSFPFADIQRGQKAKALKMAAFGGRYDFHIFSYELGQWFLMPCEQFAFAVNHDRKSIKFEELAPWTPS